MHCSTFSRVHAPLYATVKQYWSTWMEDQPPCHFLPLPARPWVQNNASIVINSTSYFNLVQLNCPNRIVQRIFNSDVTAQWKIQVFLEFISVTSCGSFTLTDTNSDQQYRYCLLLHVFTLSVQNLVTTNAYSARSSFQLTQCIS